MSVKFIDNDKQMKSFVNEMIVYAQNSRFEDYWDNQYRQGQERGDFVYESQEPEHSCIKSWTHVVTLLEFGMMPLQLSFYLFPVSEFNKELYIGQLTIADIEKSHLYPNMVEYIKNLFFAEEPKMAHNLGHACIFLHEESGLNG